MEWKQVRAGFFDEMLKIADVSLNGLSPQTVLDKSQPPPPMETPGFNKARDILSRASSIKTAGFRSGTPEDLPGLSRLTSEEKKDPSMVGKATSLAGHTLAGSGAGRYLGWASMGPRGAASDVAKQKLHSRQWYGMMAGGALGAGTYGLRKLREAKKKKSEMVKTSFTTPSLSLKASSQVGRLTTGKATRGIKSQVPLIGRKFVP